jgi:serine phosphatase RsbU (regulator of sigma subunit)
MPTVLLSSPPQFPADDLRRLLADAGFAVADHLLGSAPAVDFGPVVVAVVEIGERADVAAAQTRRWRVELGDRAVPVLWVLPFPSSEITAKGLDAGADACLVRSVDPVVFAAQVRAMARAHATAARLSERAAEARLLGDQLQKAYAQLDSELDMARRVQRTFVPRVLPEVGAARFAVCHRPRSRLGGDFYDVRRVDEDHVGFVLGDVLGTGSAAGGLLGVFVKQSAALKEISGSRYRVVPPDEVLTRVNRELLGLGLDDPPLVAMLVGLLNARDGSITVARAGLPAPVYVPAAGESETWSIPGPFLGTADTTCPPLHGRLWPGDKLVVGTDGTRPDGTPAAGGVDRLMEVAIRHRELTGQTFADAIARELLPNVRHPDDFTLLVVEMAGDPPARP